MSKLDNFGYFGPDYSFADAIPLPGQIGVRQEASVGAIIDAVGGVNYYVDTIAFGGPTFFDTQNPQPMGVRYFLNTDMRCSNGATMSEYVDDVTKGDILGTHVAAALASSGLPALRGLAPGMLENARDALDPRPIFSAVTGTGYPVCQQVMCKVGDTNGQLTDPFDSTKKYVVDPVTYVDGAPYQTRWVQAYDANGDRITITKAEFTAQPKCYNPDGTYRSDSPAGCPPTEAAAQNTSLGSDARYGSCFLQRPATMPPSLTAAEGFVDVERSLEKWLAVVAIAAIGGVALWSLQRKR
jgi:hypothetical protein